MSQIFHFDQLCKGLVIMGQAKGVQLPEALEGEVDNRIRVITAIANQHLENLCLSVVGKCEYPFIIRYFASTSGRICVSTTNFNNYNLYSVSDEFALISLREYGLGEKSPEQMLKELREYLP